MKKLLYILLFSPVFLFAQDSLTYAYDSLTLDYSLSAIKYQNPSGYNNCYNFYRISSTEISRPQYHIKKIYISYELDNQETCGGVCGSIRFDAFIFDVVNGVNGDTLYHRFLDSCNIKGTSGNIIFNTDFNESYFVLPSFDFRTVDLDSNCVFSIDSIQYINMGCMNSNAINFDENATIDDEQSCIYSQDYVHGLWNEVDDGLIQYNESVESLSSLQQALDTWNTTIDLSSGWNMFGYGCPTSIGVAEGLSNHTDIIVITKDNNGNVYMPEFGFNGIGDFTPGFGYQIKLTEVIEGFSLCDWYVNDIPEDNIVSLQEEVINIQELNAELLSLNNEQCINDGYCGFNSTTLSCFYPEQGFDCFGNEFPQVGDVIYGGIVFYSDAINLQALISDTINLGQFAWGCNTTFLTGAVESVIGTGYQNTIDMSVGCPNSGLASAALDYFSGGYSDWYLPSIDELELMYNTIGQGANNIGQFQDVWYWSSTQINNSEAAAFDFLNGSVMSDEKKYANRVRLIRSF